MKTIVHRRNCRTCKEWKPESEFRKCSRNASGLSNYCTSCVIKKEDKYKSKQKDNIQLTIKSIILSEEDKKKLIIKKYEKLGNFYS